MNFLTERINENQNLQVDIDCGVECIFAIECITQYVNDVSSYMDEIITDFTLFPSIFGKQIWKNDCTYDCMVQRFQRGFS